MLQQFLHDFGYFALFLGTFFEGETILVLAGFLRSVDTWISTWWWSWRSSAVMPAISCGTSWAKARSQVARAQAALATDG
jgi:membrane protein DedA with SNARE-associated domain